MDITTRNAIKLRSTLCIIEMENVTNNMKYKFRSYRKKCVSTHNLENEKEKFIAT